MAWHERIICDLKWLTGVGLSAERRCLRNLRLSNRRTPRGTGGTQGVLDYRLRYVDFHTLCDQFDKIFVERLYDCRLRTAAPRILDCGANIGLSVLFFLREYPKARLTAIEAAPELHRVLRLNLDGNRAEHVETLSGALWSKGGTTRFAAEGSDSGRIVESASGESTIEVPCIHLSSLLQEPVDLVKMDIEGAELTVLAEAKESLTRVRNLVLEVHQDDDGPGVLPAIMTLLDDCGFQCAPAALEFQTWRRPVLKDCPFRAIPTLRYVGMVYAWRPGDAR